jgi:hypothetical protein
MRLRRLILACLICLGASLQGFAAVSGFEPPCPMMQTAADAMADSAMPADESHDCCADADTFAKTGKTCKSGLACQPAIQAPRVAVGLVTTVSFLNLVPPDPSPRIDSVDPSLVWRPPALI